MIKNHIELACDLLGSQKKLALVLGISVQAVNKWVRSGRVPAERVLAVEAATGGKVSRHLLRPDLYPPEAA